MSVMWWSITVRVTGPLWRRSPSNQPSTTTAKPALCFGSIVSGLVKLAHCPQRIAAGLLEEVAVGFEHIVVFRQRLVAAPWRAQHIVKTVRCVERQKGVFQACLLYTSDAADDL